MLESETVSFPLDDELLLLMTGISVVLSLLPSDEVLLESFKIKVMSVVVVLSSSTTNGVVVDVVVVVVVSSNAVQLKTVGSLKVTNYKL